MENASKALLIAAAVLIAILIITIGIKISTSADGISETAKQTGDAIGDATDIAIGQLDPISKTDSYVGYYADVDGNGTVDGVIYADLAIGKTGDGQWGTNRQCEI